eukprot:5962816-Prymnesium_polylepis.1
MASSLCGPVASSTLQRRIANRKSSSGLASGCPSFGVLLKTWLSFEARASTSQKLLVISSCESASSASAHACTCSAQCRSRPDVMNFLMPSLFSNLWCCNANW